MIRTQRNHALDRAGITLVELAVVVVIIVILTLVLLPMAPWSESARLASCQGNLKEMGSIFNVYSSESPENRYPPKSPYGAAPDVAALYPDYMYDFEPLLCPEEGDFDLLKKQNPNGWYQEDGTPWMERLRREADATYTYLGFAVPNNAWVDPPEQVRPLLEQAFERRDEDTAWGDHPNPNVNVVTLYRIHPGVETILVEEGHTRGPGADGLSRLAVMWDNVSTPSDPSQFSAGMGASIVMLNHAPGGSNVLFLDGHVEFVEYGPGRFPVTGEFAEISYGGFRSDIPNDTP